MAAQADLDGSVGVIWRQPGDTRFAVAGQAVLSPFDSVGDLGEGGGRRVRIVAGSTPLSGKMLGYIDLGEVLGPPRDDSVTGNARLPGRPDDSPQADVGVARAVAGLAALRAVGGLSPLQFDVPVAFGAPLRRPETRGERRPVRGVVTLDEPYDLYRLLSGSEAQEEETSEGEDKKDSHSDQMTHSPAPRSRLKALPDPRLVRPQ